MMKSRVYKKIAQLILDDKCDDTDKIGELAAYIGRTRNYLLQNTINGTTRLREDTRKLLGKKLRLSQAVVDDHFKNAVRVNKEESK